MDLAMQPHHLIDRETESGIGVGLEMGQSTGKMIKPVSGSALIITDVCAWK